MSTEHDQSGSNQCAHTHIGTIQKVKTENKIKIIIPIRARSVCDSRSMFVVRLNPWKIAVNFSHWQRAVSTSNKCIKYSECFLTPAKRMRWKN